MTEVAIGALTLLIATGVRLVPRTRRLVVFRHGSVKRLAGPGFVYVVPPWAHVQSVRLDQIVPDWRTLNREELSLRLLLYLGQPLRFLADWSPDVPRLVRRLRHLAGGLICLSLAMLFAGIASGGAIGGLLWFRGSPLGELGALLNLPLAPGSGLQAALMLGLLMGSGFGFLTGLSIVRSSQLVPERLVYESAHGLLPRERQGKPPG